jgi:FkbM family methyltransferase
MFKPSTLLGNIFRYYLKSFSHPFKIRIQNILGKNIFSGGINLKNKDGVSFDLDANDWITRIMLLDGNYENDSTKLAKNILNDGGVFLDIGANFGLYTCITAVNNKTLSVFAVEPNYKIMGKLVNNIAINNLQNRVKVINTAVSNKMQTVALDQLFSDNMGTAVTSPTSTASLSIVSCTLDFICDTFKLDEIDLIKIDIEGNEFEILEIFPFEKYYIRNIILEFNHLSKISFINLLSFFNNKHFKCYSITGEELIDDKTQILENNIWLVNQQVKSQN